MFRGRLLDDIEFIQFVPVFSVWRNSTETVSPTDYFLVADTGSQQELIQLGGDFFQYNLSEPVEVLDDDVLGVKIARRMGQAFRLVFLSQQNSSEPIAFFIRDTSLSTFDTSSGQVNSRLPLVSPLLSSKCHYKSTSPVAAYITIYAYKITFVRKHDPIIILTYRHPQHCGTTTI